MAKDPGKSSAVFVGPDTKFKAGDKVKNHANETATVTEIRDGIMYLDMPLSLTDGRELDLSKGKS